MNIPGHLDTTLNDHYYFNDVDVSTLDDDALLIIRNKETGFIFYNFNLFPRLNVIQNVELPFIYAGTPGAKLKEKSVEVLDRVGAVGSYEL